MAMAKALVAVAAVAALAQLAAAVVHPVGGNGAWDTTGNYNAWSAKQKFSQGDSILFTYPSSHDVVEVSKAGYDACSPSNAIATYTGGSTTAKLTTPGTHYFICGVPGHCSAGMKLEVSVAAAAASAPAPTKTKPRGKRSVAPAPAPALAPDAPAVPPSTDEQPAVSSPTGAPAPKSSDAPIIGTAGAKAAVALALGMAMSLAM